MSGVRIIGEVEVRELISPLEAQHALEAAFRDFGNGISRMAARVTVGIPGIAGNMRILPAVKIMPVPRPMPPTQGYLGVKVYTGYVGPVFKDASKPRFTVLLYDMATGALLSVMAARYLGALRTGATAAVATKHMARPDGRTLAVIGTGEQAETQVTNLADLMKPERIVAYSRAEANRQAFAARLADRGYAVQPVDSAEAAVRASDVVSLATTSRAPVIERDWIRPGTHINAVGANLANRREVDAAVVRASRVVVEYREQALQEAGDLLIPIREGELTEDAIAAELADVLIGTKPGRTAPDEITLFKSIGVAIEDVAVAAAVYRKAVDQGAGTLVAL